MGKFANLKEDIVSVKLSNLNVKEYMILYAATIYDFSSNSFNICTLYFQYAIKYYEDLNIKDNVAIIEGLQAKLSWLQ